MNSLGLIDSRAISSRNGGSERHVREILKRLSSRYDIYYLPNTHIEDVSEDSLKEVKKYAKIPSFFESLLDRRPKISLFRELFTFSSLAKEMEKEYRKEIGKVDFAYIPHAYRISLMSSVFISSRISEENYGMLLMTDPHNSLLEKQSFLKCINTWNKISSSFKSAIELCSMKKIQDFIFLTKISKKNLSL